MAETDTPLKLLVTDFADVIIPWLLDDAVVHIEPENPELPAGTVLSDAIFRVALADGRQTLLHIEFQGPGSDRPMPIRMLDYVSRLAQRGEEHLCSVVLYVGEGTGRDDQGQYAVTCPNTDEVTLSWRYRVIRLWDMTVADLLDEERPALLPLAGLTKLAEGAEAELREAVLRISVHENEEERARMLTLFVSLLPTKELTAAMERMIGDMNERLLLDTPFLRRIREQGVEEGLERGREEGLRRAILKALVTRFDFSVRTYQRFEDQLAAVDNEELLEDLLHVALSGEMLEAFDEKLGAMVAA
jgi:predicted transposase YdaD